MALLPLLALPALALSQEPPAELLSRLADWADRLGFGAPLAFEYTGSN